MEHTFGYSLFEVSFNRVLQWCWTLFSSPVEEVKMGEDGVLGPLGGFVKTGVVWHGDDLGRPVKSETRITVEVCDLRLTFLNTPKEKKTVYFLCSIV